MPKKKSLKELRKAHDLLYGGALGLQAVDVLKARKDTVRLSQLGAGSLQIGIAGAIGQKAFELAATPIRMKKSKKKKKWG